MPKRNYRNRQGLPITKSFVYPLLFYKNILYKNIEAEISEFFKDYVKIVPEAEIFFRICACMWKICKVMKK